MTGAVAVKHPAKFNDAILSVIQHELDARVVDGWVLDPFAGVGGVHRLTGYGTVGVELEPEWAEQAAQLGPTYCMDFFQWEPVVKIGAVVTSPTYGNRMADHHEPRPGDVSKRITYKHVLGRELSDNNSGEMGWGVDYRAFHIKAWIKVRELLMGGGWFIVNVKDHVRRGEVIEVADWHKRRIVGTGFREVADVKVPVTGMGFGANGTARVDHERVMVFERMRDESNWNVEGAARRASKAEVGAAARGVGRTHVR